MAPSILDLFLGFGSSRQRGRLVARMIPQDPSFGFLDKTYGEFQEDVLRFLDYFSTGKQGFLAEPEGTVALCGNNCYEWIIAFFAIALSGQRMLLLDPALPPETLERSMRLLGCHAAIASPRVVSSLSALGVRQRLVSFHSRDLEGEEHVSSFYDVFDAMFFRTDEVRFRASRLSLCRARLQGLRQRDGDEKRFHFLTSGTTGSPRIVALSERNLVAAIPSLLEATGIGSSDVFLGILPFFHVFGLGASLLSPLFKGAGVVVPRSLSADVVMAALQKGGVTVLPAVPAFWKLLHDAIVKQIEKRDDWAAKALQAFVRAPRGFVPARLDALALAPVKRKVAPTLRLVISGGARPNESHLRFFMRMGVTVTEGYGLTETAGALCVSDGAFIGTVGRACGENEFRIDAPDDSGVGEICVRGASVFAGYLTEKGVDASSIDADGYFHTGDLGCVDSRGNLYVRGRIKEVIVLSTGKNVYPDDLEFHYGESSLVAEICVVGVSFSGSEKVCAVVFPNLEVLHARHGGQDWNAVVRAELDALGKGLPSYQRISEIALSGSPLPRTQTRKFRRDEVRSLFLKERVRAGHGFVLPATALPERTSDPETTPPEQPDRALRQVCALALCELPERFARMPVPELAALDLERDLGLDSLARVSLVCRAAESLGVAVELGRFAGAQTIAEAVALLQEMPSQNPPETARKAPEVEKSWDGDAEAVRLYGEFSKPRMAEMLRTLGLDRVYHRASGTRLFYRDGEGREASVLDCVGGYGSTVLGHHHPEVVAAAREALEAGIPVHAQMSVKRYAGELARCLSEAVGADEPFVTTFANTGTEAAEAAMKHALLLFSRRVEAFRKVVAETFALLESDFAHGRLERLVWRGKNFASVASLREALSAWNEEALRRHEPRFLAARKSFHGKTLGALELTYKEEYRSPFVTRHADFFDCDASALSVMVEKGQFSLEMPTRRMDKGRVVVGFRPCRFVRHAGLFLEPIQGEGGVLPMAPEFLREVRALTKKHGIFFCLDEIQSGFFRTGEFLASARSGVAADAYLLGKSMGGGLVKVSACLVRSSLYDGEFGVLHTSTFAEDDFSTFIALRAFHLTKSLACEIQAKGVRLREGLCRIQQEFPTVIKEVRGEGLMLAVEFRDFLRSRSGALQLLSRTGFFNYVMAAHLLHESRIRVSAPLSTSGAVRIQPAVTLGEGEMEELFAALRRLCRVLFFEDVYKLLEFLFEPSLRGLRAEPQDFRHGEVHLEEPAPGAVSVGFEVHYPDNAVRLTEPSLMVLPDETLVSLLRDFLPLAKPLVVGSKNVWGATGSMVHMTFAALPFTAAMYREDVARGQADDYLRLCREAAGLLETEAKVSLVGLGQYTSIITSNGEKLGNPRVGVTTGNAFTVAASLQMLLARARETGLEPARETLALIGAGGNIASMYGECFSRHCAKALLLGSPRGFARAQDTARRILWNAWQSLARHPEAPDGELEKFLAATTLAQALREKKGGPGNGAELERALRRECGECPVRAVRSLDELSRCRLVVASTSEQTPFLKPSHFPAGAVVCDISVPTNCTPELLANDKGISVIRGGIVAMPGGEALPILGFPLKPGHAYACMTEALVLGLEGRSASFAFGRLEPAQVESISQWARKHGFEPVLRSLEAHVRNV